MKYSTSQTGFLYMHLIKSGGARSPGNVKAVSYSVKVSEISRENSRLMTFWGP